MTTPTVQFIDYDEYKIHCFHVHYTFNGQKRTADLKRNRTQASVRAMEIIGNNLFMALDQDDKQARRNIESLLLKMHEA